MMMAASATMHTTTMMMITAVLRPLLTLESENSCDATFVEKFSMATSLHAAFAPMFCAAFATILDDFWQSRVNSCVWFWLYAPSQFLRSL